MEKPRIRIYFRNDGDLFFQLLNRPDIEDRFMYWITNKLRNITIELAPISVLENMVAFPYSDYPLHHNDKC